jgi:hypothetical protein
VGDEVMPKMVPLAQPRALSLTERTYLDFLLAEADGADELLAQAAAATVTAACDCGCLSVDLDVDPMSPRPPWRDMRYINAETSAQGDPHIHVVVEGGRLIHLEIWPIDGARDNPPPVSSLRHAGTQIVPWAD